MLGGLFFLGSVDNEVISTIAKEHDLEFEVVKEKYVAMLKELGVESEK